jgi:uncharacterized repeat protein (TIGR03803 family)
MIDQTSFAPTLRLRTAPLNRWSTLNTAAAVLLLCVATASPAQTFTSLLSFDEADGYLPYAGLVQGTDGNLYGVTAAGGTGGYGTVFKISPAGVLTTLHIFADDADGVYPTSGLVQGMDGDFYGTTAQGGAHSGGTVFKITSGGTLTTLYDFCAQPSCADGSSPSYAALVEGVGGTFYGTTSAGGTAANGTVFKISSAGKLTTLHSFYGAPDGQSPIAALVRSSNGSLYGTTYLGGMYDGGAAFKIDPSGAETIIYSFCSEAGCPDGDWPEAGLIVGADGSFYGTTLQGGDIGGGTVFEIAPTGKETTLYSFGAEGGNPTSSLVLGTDGNLYGTALNGLDGVFELDQRGELILLYSFTGADGSNPYAGLLQATNGTFYGTTLYGGTSNACTYGCGTVFSLSTGLGPFVKPQPTSGKVGARVVILGTDLAGTTAVSFNGAAATFTASNSAIETTVPEGATTGTLTVTSPGGTLSSNVVFRVVP